MGNSLTPINNIAKVDVLWESYGTSAKPTIGSIINNTSYNGNTISFFTPSTLMNGNAVISAKDASDNILWSWHIWVCKDYNPISTGQVYYNNAGTMMDRNLGATSALPGEVGSLGLLYQWGRKDPFLSGNSISSSTQAASTFSWPSPVSSTSSNGTINYAVKNPTTFIIRNTKNYDWCYTGDSSSDDNRWQSSKTIYDPCPPGWRVPDGGENGVWSTAVEGSGEFSYPWNSTNMGMNFSGKFGNALSIWYPAAGYMYDVYGNLQYVGNCVSWWSCTSDGYCSGILELSNMGTVSPSHIQSRAYGYSVRCRKE